MSAIELSKVSMWFGDFQALDTISLAVDEGEFVSLVGPSGCGKTTLLRIISGLEKPTSGGVAVLGGSPLAACKNRLIGVAFQRPALIPSQTALQNVQLTAEITRRTDNSLSAESLLLDFGLEQNSLVKYPHQLSGGMQQRVDLACAIVHNPPVLLLDEPFGPLDLITREAMGEWLENVLDGSPKTVVLVTHSPEEAVFFSDEVVVFSPHPGKIIGVVEVDLHHPRSRETRLKTAFTEKVVEVKTVLYSGINNTGRKA